MRWLGALAALLIVLAGCRERDTRHHAPLPRAYPRIQMPDSTFRAIDSTAVPIVVNAGASVSVDRRPGGEWIDITYPGFPDGRVYLTLSRVGHEAIEAAVDNRLQRMALNAGSLPGRQTRLVSQGGWEAMMLVTPASISTPVQVLASGPGIMLSGVFHISVPPSTPPDSVAPVVKAVERDMLTMLRSL